jgi:hypothetical protein
MWQRNSGPLGRSKGNAEERRLYLLRSLMAKNSIEIGRPDQGKFQWPDQCSEKFVIARQGEGSKPQDRVKLNPVYYRHTATKRSDTGLAAPKTVGSFIWSSWHLLYLGLLNRLLLTSTSA